MLGHSSDGGLGIIWRDLKYNDFLAGCQGHKLALPFARQ
jgi:hypothetical protein